MVKPVVSKLKSSDNVKITRQVWGLENFTFPAEPEH